MAIKLKDSSGNVSLTTPVIKEGVADLTNYYTKDETDTVIDAAVQSIDFTPYATKVELEQYDTSHEVDAKIAAIEIPETDLTGYAKEDWVTEQIEGIDIPEVDLDPYALKTEIPDTSNFATKEEIPDLENYTTKDYVSNALTPYAKTDDIPDTSNFATKTEIPDVSAYQTETQVNTLISNALANIGVAEEGAY